MAGRGGAERGVGVDEAGVETGRETDSVRMTRPGLLVSQTRPAMHTLHSHSRGAGMCQLLIFLADSLEVLPVVVQFPAFSTVVCPVI